MSSPTLYPKFHAFDPSTGLPLVGGKLFTYVAGTTTPQATYSDAGLTTPNANPVILDANGEAAIYVGPLSYKLVLQKSDGSAVWTFDNYAPNLATNALTAPEWLPLTGTLAFVSGTQFKVLGVDVTATLTVGRRLKTTNTAGTVYATITASGISGSDTAITVVTDSGALDSGLSAVAYGVNSFLNPSYLDPRSAVSAYLNVDITGFVAKTQVIAFNEDLDALNEFNAGVFTAKYPGNYLISFRTEATDTSAGSSYYSIINVNGVETANVQLQPTASGYTATHVLVVAALTAGQQVKFYFQSGSATTTLRKDAAAVVTNRATQINITRLP